MDINLLKKCDFCGENIPRDASRCPYCASILETAAGESSEPSVPEPQQGAFGDSDMPHGSEDAPVRDTDAGEAQQSGAGTGSDRQDPSGQHPGYREQGTDPSKTQYYSTYQPRMMPKRGRPPLGNGLKVFLTVLFTLLPGIGQLAGIITAIVFMSADDDHDRRSFGAALLVANIIMFVLSCFGCFIFWTIFASGI